MAIVSRNPATGEIGRSYQPLTPEEVTEKIERAASAFSSYRHVPYGERAALLVRAAEIVEGEKARFGRIMTAEMGKPFSAAIQEAEKCAWACRFYAENGERFLADEHVTTNAGESYVHYQPLGAVLAVMPWNFPFWQVFRFAAPALMAGNVGLLKHASNVPECALAIEEIFARAGFPAGAFQTLLIGSEGVRRVIEDPAIKAVTLTGSEPAGRIVAGAAGAGIKKTVLELGGSDPFIVMPSADLDEAVRIAVRARTINNGQSCIAAKRFIIAEEITGKFIPRFVQAMEALRVCDPFDAGCDIGPLATEEIRSTLHEQVRRSAGMGARILTGGRLPEGPGYFYPPTVLDNIPKGSPAYEEEVFGPVALLFHVRDAGEAVRLANDTSFGLGSSAWTRDHAERQFFIENLESGAVFINGMVASDPRLPFGGVKNSGYGRELGSHGIREFVNIKTVWIAERD